MHFLRQSVRRIRHARAIRSGQFGDVGDPLFRRLEEWVSEGDWVLDVGAAVGDYALPLSELVGATGRVIALEPMEEQFEVLVGNAAFAGHRNLTCLQLAAGSETDLCRMTAPSHRGVPNWYQAAVTESGDTPVFRVALDDLPIPRPVSFLKIDAEGHDFEVLKGATHLIDRNRDLVILMEADEPRIVDWLEEHGYGVHISPPDSPNQVHLRSPGRHQPGLES